MYDFGAGLTTFTFVCVVEDSEIRLRGGRLHLAHITLTHCASAVLVYGILRGLLLLSNDLVLTYLHLALKIHNLIALRLLFFVALNNVGLHTLDLVIDELQTLVYNRFGILAVLRNESGANKLVNARVLFQAVELVTNEVVLILLGAELVACLDELRSLRLDFTDGLQVDLDVLVHLPDVGMDLNLAAHFASVCLKREE